MKPNHSKKILFAHVPADGHFNPLTSIAVHLKELGYDVRWYSSRSYAAKIEKLGIPQFLYKKALEVTTENVDELFPDRAQISSKVKKLNYDLQQFFLKRAPEYYADILDVYREFPFDLMIADCMFGANAFVKGLMNIPVLAVGVMPVMENSRDLPPAGLGMHPATTLAGKMKHSFLRWLCNKVLFAPSNRQMHEMYDHYGIQHDRHGFFDACYRNATLVLQSGSPSFDYERSDLSSNIRYIGPLLPYHSARQGKAWYDERLHRYDRVLLVTQGTAESDTTKLLIPTLEAFKDSSCLVVATTAGNDTEKLRRRFPQDNIIIEDFIPFNEVMPYAHVYITNGGFGGVLLGIEHHLPLVVAGVHEGKNEINARIGYFELGIDLRTERPRPAALKAAVEKVLASNRYRSNVKRLAGEFRTYSPRQLAAGYVREVLLTQAPTAFLSPHASVY